MCGQAPESIRKSKLEVSGTECCLDAVRTTARTIEPPRQGCPLHKSKRECPGTTRRTSGLAPVLKDKLYTQAVTDCPVPCLSWPGSGGIATQSCTTKGASTDKYGTYSGPGCFPACRSPQCTLFIEGCYGYAQGISLYEADSLIAEHCIIKNFSLSWRLR